MLSVVCFDTFSLPNSTVPSNAYIACLSNWHRERSQHPPRGENVCVRLNGTNSGSTSLTTEPDLVTRILCNVAFTNESDGVVLLNLLSGRCLMLVRFLTFLLSWGSTEVTPFDGRQPKWQLYSLIQLSSGMKISFFAATSSAAFYPSTRGRHFVSEHLNMRWVSHTTWNAIVCVGALLDSSMLQT